ncbi:MAG: response regulator [Lachnospiraceae bacterium]|nr:response regulator [Lachnospiraceae bacterium]
MKNSSILIVDDEEWAINGIVEGVDWERLGIERVYKAHNRETAVRMLLSYDIPLVITDIEMPNGSGIDLLRWIRSEKPQTLCIFYTGYAEFRYAQEAVRLGVFDYLLKPIAYHELEEILQKALSEIQRDSNLRSMEQMWEEVSAEEQDSAVERVKKFIVEHIDEDLQRETLAAMVHLNSGYLSKLFKKKENMSIGDYILKKRMAVAKQLLEKTNLQISVIASRVGISYASYFTKIFKEQEGISPQQYRKQSRNETEDISDV